MKKQLLVSLAIVASASAFAALTDVTPANYKFNDVDGFSYHSVTFTGANIPAPVWASINGDENFNNGLVILSGNAAHNFGPNLEGNGPASVVAGTSIVDLGGEVGKVLCISGPNSKINAEIESIFGFNPEIPNMTENPGWFAINFFGDPNTLDLNPDKDYNVRIRLTCNFFANKITDGVSYVNPYPKNNVGNNPWGANNQITTDQFVLFDEEGTPVDRNGDESEEYFWDPDKWLVYEMNCHCRQADNDGVYSPVFLKYDIKADNLCAPSDGGTMFIKSVEFFNVPVDERSEKGVEQHMITLKADPKPAGIQSAVVAPAKVHINGSNVSFDNAATVYTATGMQVVSAAADQHVTMAPGLYIANVGGKAVKFVVR